MTSLSCRNPSVTTLFAIVLSLSSAFSGSSERVSSNSPQSVNTNDRYRPFLINQVFNYFGNNGDGSYNTYSADGEGFEYPKGVAGHTIIFEDGVVWGGYHKGRVTPKVGGSVYRHGLQAGKILTAGTLTSDPVADNPSLPVYRVYRVRPDINPHTTFSEVEQLINTTETVYISRYETLSSQNIYDQYIQDWNEWPAGDGAPFTDVDTNGVYNPGVDIPGQPGSDQTLWYVANDCDASRTAFLAGSPVIGLEMRRTIWGYNRTGALGSTIFESTKLINKSGASIDTMFLIQWSDPDLGDGTDDFVGCDTTTPSGANGPRNLGFVYNGRPSDLHYGTAVPAGGFSLLQGPIVHTGNPADTAVFEFRFRPGYKNLNMTTFDFFTNGSATYADPIQGAGGDVQWYRLMKGTSAPGGAPFIDPNSGQPTKFTLAGDPVLGRGWVDGSVAPPGDRRMCVVTGSFTMAIGDTQEIVVANLAGLGGNRYASITILRTFVDQVQAAFRGMVRPLTGVSRQESPAGFSISQNYPNPFNPSTTIRYSLARNSLVKLTVCNALGQQVAQLVNRQQEVGNHEVVFHAEGLASGVYFARFSVSNAGGAVAYTKVNKLILMK